MDPRQFDRIARVVGAGASRRRVLGAFAGAFAATFGFGKAEAAAKRSVGNSCRVNGDCASNLCVAEGRSRKICHCASPADCPAVSGQCRAAVCLPSGSCGVSVNAGAPCDDGNRCTVDDACQPDGSCVGAPVVCSARDACHLAGTCDPATGTCSNPSRPSGAVCGSAPNFCTAAPVCDGNGNCVSGGAIDCNDDDVCTIDSCDPAVGCVHTLANCDDNNPCTVDTCDATLGCVHTPVVCDDNNPCTIDTCDISRGCVYTPVVCTVPNDCYTAGMCDPANGCSAPTYRGDGATCGGGTCSGGVCSSGGGGGGGGGCFAAGARVTMADGTTKPIEHMVVGDLVRGRGGAVNSVLAIQTPRLGARPLHAINGGPYFVTASHPFQTRGGLKSIDPEATARETGRRVGRLIPGDQLLGDWDERNGPEPGVEGHRLIAVEAIASEWFDAATGLYNLIISGDGSHQIGGYFAIVK